MRITWADDIATALRQLDGEAHRSQIIKKVRAIRDDAGRSTPATFEQTLQQALERHCKESDIWNGKSPRFQMVNRGSGIYRLIE